MDDIGDRLSAAFGRAIVSYPFMMAAAAVIAALDGSRGTRQADFPGWLAWALLWVGIAALAAGLIVLPILVAEVLLWGFVAERNPWLQTTWPGAIVSDLALAVPWALAPNTHGWETPGLIFLGLIIARVVVPSLRPESTEAGA